MTRIFYATAAQRERIDDMIATFANPAFYANAALDKVGAASCELGSLIDRYAVTVQSFSGLLGKHGILSKEFEKAQNTLQSDVRAMQWDIDMFKTHVSDISDEIAMYQCAAQVILERKLAGGGERSLNSKITLLKIAQGQIDFMLRKVDTIGQSDLVERYGKKKPDGFTL